MQRFVYPTLLITVLCLTGFAQLQAQCTPLASIPGGEIIDPLPYTEENPENGIRDTACAGMEYETVIHIAAPDTVDLGVIGLLPIDSVVISGAGITGVPASFSFDCSSDDCVFYPNEVGCIRIFGTPTAAEIGEYLLEVSVTIYSGALPLNQTLPDATLAPGEYRLFVREAGNPACEPNNIVEDQNDQFALTLAPNPAQEFTTLNVTARQNTPGQLRLVDATGRLVRTHQLDLLGGDNQFRISTLDLAPGLYTVQLTDGRQGVSTRLVVIR